MNWLIGRRGVKGWGLALDSLRVAQVECVVGSQSGVAQTVSMNEEDEDEAGQRKDKKWNTKRGV
jgi:hypothetical protein